MAKKREDYQKVYQIKVVLLNTKPPVWRRIQVPEDYSFWDLHVAIQDAMGWYDGHLHGFRLFKKENPRDWADIGLPDPEWEPERVLPDWKTNIKDWLTKKWKKVEYEYDFGDGWTHSIVLEKILPRENNAEYPRCVKGKRACPPEDCGGPWGYEEFLEAIKNPKHKRHKEMVEWWGDDNFDPEYFNCAEIEFDDPDGRFISSGIFESLNIKR